MKPFLANAVLHLQPKSLKNICEGVPFNKIAGLQPKTILKNELHYKGVEELF